MKVGERHYHTIWLNEDGRAVDIIDQRWLPHDFRVVTLKTVADIATAIRDMWVRGAPLIGVTAAYGVAIAMAKDPSDAHLDAVWEELNETRPTAINLRWALERMQRRLLPLPPAARAGAARDEAIAICDEDVRTNEAIGTHGLALLRQRQAERQAQAGDEGRSGRHHPTTPACPTKRVRCWKANLAKQFSMT